MSDAESEIANRGEDKRPADAPTRERPSRKERRDDPGRHATLVPSDEHTETPRQTWCQAAPPSVDCGGGGRPPVAVAIAGILWWLHARNFDIHRRCIHRHALDSISAEIKADDRDGPSHRQSTGAAGADLVHIDIKDYKAARRPGQCAGAAGPCKRHQSRRPARRAARRASIRRRWRSPPRGRRWIFRRQENERYQDC